MRTRRVLLTSAVTLAIACGASLGCLCGQRPRAISKISSCRRRSMSDWRQRQALIWERWILAFVDPKIEL